MEQKVWKMLNANQVDNLQTCFQFDIKRHKILHSWWFWAWFLLGCLIWSRAGCGQNLTADGWVSWELWPKSWAHVIRNRTLLICLVLWTSKDLRAWFWVPGKVRCPTKDSWGIYSEWFKLQSLVWVPRLVVWYARLMVSISKAWGLDSKAYGSSPQGLWTRSQSLVVCIVRLMVWILRLGGLSCKAWWFELQGLVRRLRD